ncbi:MAG: TAXI family TRAP transporter solute-binding subunit [Alphaproteobacteria bacterium]|nr:TAXI family TRAP transporter solute-binding subunit [Alphaproteobacteria bacterium]
MRTKLAMTGLAAALAAGVATSASAENVTILGGGLKGQPYQFAVGLSKILKDKAGVDATPQSAKGMVAQARIVAKGGAQFAWGLGGPVGAWAYKGQQRFEKEGAKKNLRAVLSYPFGMFQWVTLAESGIGSVNDFKGKKVSVGSAASTTQTFARFFLPAHGLKGGDYKELTPGFSGGFNSLRDKAVDAHLTMGLPPMSAVQELTALKKIRLVDMDKAALAKVVQNYGPGISLATIAPGTYGKNQMNDKPVNTLFIYFGFSTSADVPADTVYKVTKTLFENLKEFHGTAKAAKNVTLKDACAGLSFPLHEGAKRYYKEIGRTECR